MLGWKGGKYSLGGVLVNIESNVVDIYIYICVCAWISCICWKANEIRVSLVDCAG